MTVQGFWDGDNIWKIRFSPTASGSWSYETSSSDRGLNGISGSLEAVEPTGEDLSTNPLNHGFLEANGYSWKLSDGTPFLPVGDTQWSFAEEMTTGEWERWMRARHAQGFNSFLGTVWLAIYDRPEATQPPFPGSDPTTGNLQVAYFQRLDHLVAYANDQGIMMGLAIGGFPGNSKWFALFQNRENNDRWFKYVVDRYAAYNVRWVLYGEANDANPPWGGTWQDEVAHSAQLVKEEDPYDHPVGSHHSTVDLSSAPDPNIDFIEVQIERTERQFKTALMLRKYKKPIWFEEYWYEARTRDDEVELGIRNTHRNFIAAMAFPTMGSLMRDHYPYFRIGEVESDPGAIRMCYFESFYKGLDMQNFSPATDLVSTGQGGRFGDDFAIFLQRGGSVMIDLRNVEGSFAVKRLDINSGNVDSLDPILGGDIRKLDSRTNHDVAILLINESDSRGIQTSVFDVAGVSSVSAQNLFDRFSQFFPVILRSNVSQAPVSCNP